MIWKPILHTGPLPTQRPLREHSGKDCKRGPSWIYMVDEKKGAILLSLLHNNKAKYFLAWRSSWKKNWHMKETFSIIKCLTTSCVCQVIMKNIILDKFSWHGVVFSDCSNFPTPFLSGSLKIVAWDNWLQDCCFSEILFFFSLSLSIFIYWTLEAFFPNKVSM